MSGAWEPCPLFWLRSAGFPFARLDALRFDGAVAAIDRALELEEAGEPAERDRAWEQAEAAMAEDLAAARVSLRTLLGDDRVREALFLSSRKFSENLEQHLAQPIAPRKSRSRQKERTAVKYLQRFYAKNETISFFGPLAWGELDPDSGDGLALEPAQGDLIGRRMVSFEHWAVQKLARTISEDPLVIPQLAPRLNPACHVEGDVLLYPVARKAQIDPRMLAVLERADGSTPWAVLIEELSSHPAFAEPGRSPLEVASEMIERRILSRDILIPTVVANPERLLLERVSALTGEAKLRWEPRIQELCDLTRRFADAGLDERKELSRELNQVFVELTGASSERRAGEMYAARTLLYEDCERNVGSLRIGQPLLRRFESLSPLLDIARWVTLELPRRYAASFLDVFRRLSGGGGAVDFVQFVRETQWLAQSDRVEQVLREEVEEAWVEVLGDRFREDAEIVSITAKDCADVLEELTGGFPEEGRGGILGANYLSPDFLLAAESDEALRRGEGLLIMGELHKAVFLAAQPVAQPFCPDPERLFASVERAVDGKVLSIVDAPKSYVRSDANWPDLPCFHEIVTEGAVSRFPDERAVPVGKVEVVEEDGELFVMTREGEHRTPLFSVLSGFLHKKLLGIDPIELPGESTPRICLDDDVVIRRRRWHVDTEDLQVGRAKPDSAAMLAAARRFQRGCGLPDRIFVKSPNEPKPIYIDFRSFFLVELLFKLAQEAPYLSMSEMLPGAEHLWLVDGEGERYTSEIRTSFLWSPT